MVEESEEAEFIAIVNYAVIGLIQLEKGLSEDLDADAEEILNLYQHYTNEAKA